MSISYLYTCANTRYSNIDSSLKQRGVNGIISLLAPRPIQTRTQNIFLEQDLNNNSKLNVQTYQLTNGDILECMIKDGMKNGPATLTFVDSQNRVCIEKLTYKDDIKVGKWIRTYDNGVVFEGMFKDGKAEGPATLTMTNGDILECLLVNGKKEGPATLTMANGDVEKFSFINGKANGLSTIYFNNGDVEKFTIIDGKVNGPAIRLFKNGDVEEFMIKDGKRV